MEEIDAFSKIDFESAFQEYSSGGCISYIEIPNLENNLEAALTIIQYIYDHIMYAELNTKSDYCQCCGYNGEIVIEKDEGGKLIWKCPSCGAELIIRKDDAVETVRHRLEVYHEQTEVLKNFYRSQGKLRTVNGNQSIDGANRDILKAIEANV